MKQKILCFLIFLSASCAVRAQETIQPKQLDDPSKGIVYNQEFALGLRLHTNGFAVGAYVGKLQTYYRTKYWHFELGELRHSREYRQSNESSGSAGGRIARAYKFGKQNSLYVLRAGLGVKRYFSEKAKHKGVAVGLSYEAGATLGMLKPYYLELKAADGQFSSASKYSEQTADRFLNQDAILGSSGWTKGLSELSLLPGLHGRFAVHFDWGAFDEYVKSVEGGIMVDAFTKKAPIMVDADGVENRQIFLNLFLNLQFGKRW